MRKRWLDRTSRSILRADLTRCHSGKHPEHVGIGMIRMYGDSLRDHPHYYGELAARAANVVISALLAGEPNHPDTMRKLGGWSRVIEKVVGLPDPGCALTGEIPRNPIWYLDAYRDNGAIRNAACELLEAWAKGREAR